MFVNKLAAIAAVPLLWASLAVAQPAAGDAPAGTMAMQPHPMMDGAVPPKDLAKWHKGMCTERYAHQSAHLAYLEAKLALTDKQRPAWIKWQQWEMQAAAQDRDACLANTPKDNIAPTALDREAALEKGLALHLQSLQASRPALQALYDVLTPEQRAVLDHPEEGPVGRRFRHR